LKKLAEQYWRYGFWKFKMLKRYPHTLRWRQALPPVFVLILLSLIVLSLVLTFAQLLLALQLFAYYFVLGAAGLRLAIKTRKGFLIWGLPLAITTMHITWGAGFLWSGITSLLKNG
jgi:succinoglycan biosynthesis protein ExoA